MNKMHSIKEMARIDDPNISPRTLGQCEVWIYREDKSVLTPHFHFLRRTDTTFEIEIQLSDLKIIKSKPRKGVDNNDILTWKGLVSERRMLLKWLDESNSDYVERTNKEVLIKTWNQNNRNNQIKIDDKQAEQ